jgi:hypothetical protein
MGHALPRAVSNLRQTLCRASVFGFDNQHRARPILMKRHPVMATIRADLVAGSYSPLELAELYRFPEYLDGTGQCIGISADPASFTVRSARLLSMTSRLCELAYVWIFSRSADEAPNKCTKSL